MSIIQKYTMYILQSSYTDELKIHRKLNRVSTLDTNSIAQKRLQSNSRHFHLKNEGIKCYEYRVEETIVSRNRLRRLL